MMCSNCKHEVDKEFIIKLRKCNHVFCFRCISHHINDNFDVIIKCPIRNCCKNISDGDLRKFLSNDQIKLYEDLSVKTASSQIRKCLSKDCNYYFIPEGKDFIFECAYCKVPNCLHCDRRHYGHGACLSPINEKPMDEIAGKNILKLKRQEFDYLDKKYNLIPNPNSFECVICYNFIIPREGYILRNCLDTFCRSCLEDTFEKYRFLNQTSCPTCKFPLEQRESAELIGLQKLVTFCIKEKRYKYFNCKQADCDNFWSVEKKSGFHTCNKCKSVNCLSCCAVHTNMSCDDYFQAHGSEFNDFLEKEEKTYCYYCGKLLVKDGGCGSLKCTNCNNQTCLFTGQEVGETGCKCATDKPCHKECKYGCLKDP